MEDGMTDSTIPYSTVFHYFARKYNWLCIGIYRTERYEKARFEIGSIATIDPKMLSDRVYQVVSRTAGGVLEDVEHNEIDPDAHAKDLLTSVTTFTFTNPPPETRIRRSDLIFIVTAGNPKTMAEMTKSSCWNKDKVKKVNKPILQPRLSIDRTTQESSSPENSDNNDVVFQLPQESSSSSDVDDMFEL